MSKHILNRKFVFLASEQRDILMSNFCTCAIGRFAVIYGRPKTTFSLRRHHLEESADFTVQANDTCLHYSRQHIHRQLASLGKCARIARLTSSMKNNILYAIKFRILHAFLKTPGVGNCRSSLTIKGFARPATQGRERINAFLLAMLAIPAWH